MTGELSYGREPVTIVELRQPRCGLRFGEAPCTATGTPKCYQTWGTCRDRENIDLSGSITWRFVEQNAGIWPLYEESGEDIATNGIPMLVSVSTASSELNVGSLRDGMSPLGIRSSVTVQLQDAPWDDHVGDFYLADRAGVRGTFWGKWRARNAFYNRMLVSVYEGYRGQAIGDMVRRDYILEEVTGPDAQGRVTLKGSDPLRLAQAKQALFPRPTQIDLIEPLPETGNGPVQVASSLADLADGFGVGINNLRYLRIGSEIISYQGQTEDSAGVYTLTGVQRGALGTPVSAAQQGASCQRVGRYENIAMWRIAADLIDSHTTIPAGYRDVAGWDDEGETYLPNQAAWGTVEEPTSVERLLGELCQQGNFAIWWDERAQSIPMLANRPPREAPTVLTDRDNILADSWGVRDQTENYITRVLFYYDRRSQTGGLTDPRNYRRARLFIDGDVEAEEAADDVRALEIYSRWVVSPIDALQTCARIVLRYRFIPRYLEFSVDAKDRALSVGNVCDIRTAAIQDSEGNDALLRWQVVRAEETEAGHMMALRLQSYTYIGRFGNWMPDGSNDYATATDEEKATGAFWSDANGQMPGGDEGYLYQ